MNFTKIKYSVADRVATISLDDPESMNAFDGTMLDELVTAFKKAEDDANVKAVLLNSTSERAEQPAFSAGGNVKAMHAGFSANPPKIDDFTNAIAKMASVTMAIMKIPKPVVCAVSGACVGAGFNVALACDYIIASDASLFMQAFARIGLIPDAGGMYLLTRAIGTKRAMQLCLTADMIYAPEAKELGIVAELVEGSDDDFTTAVEKRMKRFAGGPSTSYAQMKRLIWESSFKDFEQFVKAEVDAQSICAQTSDFKEGIFAFVEKRRANFA